MKGFEVSKRNPHYERQLYLENLSLKKNIHGI